MSALASALLLAACGGVEQDEATDEAAIYRQGEGGFEDEGGGEEEVAFDDSSYTVGGACNSKNGDGPYPGTNGTYNSKGECCWYKDHSTTCLDCSTGNCKDVSAEEPFPIDFTRGSELIQDP